MSTLEDFVLFAIGNLVAAVAVRAEALAVVAVVAERAVTDDVTLLNLHNLYLDSQEQP